jgi:hypothetical protein
LVDFGVDGKVILKRIINKYDIREWALSLFNRADCTHRLNPSFREQRGEFHN